MAVQILSYREKGGLACWYQCLGVAGFVSGAGAITGCFVSVTGFGLFAGWLDGAGANY